MRKSISGVFLMLLLAAVALRGMDLEESPKGVRRDGSARETEGRSHKTMLFDLQLFNCPPDTARRINLSLREKLIGLPNCEILDRDASAPCHSAECSIERGKRAGAHRALYGFVSRSTEIEKKRLGSSGAERYIIKNERHDAFFIKLKLVDVGTGEMIAELSEECGPESLEGAVGDLAARLGAFYQARLDTAVVEDVPEAKGPLKAAEDKAAEGIAEQGDWKKRFMPLEYDLGLYFSSMMPMGDFGDVASFSAGFGIEGRLRSAAAEHIELRSLAGFYFLSSEAGNVSSYRALSLALLAGYRFEPYRGLLLTPLLGGGYIFHFVDGGGGKRSYADPLVSFRLGIDYEIYRNIRLMLAPGYSVFFEKSGTGMYPSIDLGAVYSF